MSARPRGVATAGRRPPRTPRRSRLPSGDRNSPSQFAGRPSFRPVGTRVPRVTRHHTRSEGTWQFPHGFGVYVRCGRPVRAGARANTSRAKTYLSSTRSARDVGCWPVLKEPPASTHSTQHPHQHLFTESLAAREHVTWAGMSKETEPQQGIASTRALWTRASCPFGDDTNADHADGAESRPTSGSVSVPDGLNVAAVTAVGPRGTRWPPQSRRGHCGMRQHGDR